MDESNNSPWSLRAIIEQGLQGQVFTFIVGLAGLLVLGPLSSVAPFTSGWNDTQKWIFVAGVGLMAFVAFAILGALAQSFIPALRRSAAPDSPGRISGSSDSTHQPLKERIVLYLVEQSYTVGPATWTNSEWAIAVTDAGGRIAYIWKGSGRDFIGIASGRILNDYEKALIGLMPPTTYQSQIHSMQAELAKMLMLHDLSSKEVYMVNVDYPCTEETFSEAVLTDHLTRLRAGLIVLNDETAKMLARAQTFLPAPPSHLPPDTSPGQS